MKSQYAKKSDNVIHLCTTQSYRNHGKKTNILESDKKIVKLIVGSIAIYLEKLSEDVGEIADNIIS